MGKSYLGRHVLAAEFGLVHQPVDRLYQQALVAAGLAAPRDIASLESKRARRWARDRRWPSEAARVDFFDSYRDQVQELIRLGQERRCPVVLEGGTLGRREEASIVLACLAEAHGEAARAVRATVVLSYEAWLRNRISRLSAAGVESVRIAQVSQQLYENRVQDAEPELMEGVEDHRVGSVDEVRELVREIRRSFTVDPDEQPRLP
jgi:hypothetical protein